jgi:hypothetical protein
MTLSCKRLMNYSGYTILTKRKVRVNVTLAVLSVLVHAYHKLAIGHYSTNNDVIIVFAIMLLQKTLRLGFQFTCVQEVLLQN